MVIGQWYARGLFVAGLMGLFAAGEARAAYIITVQPSGADVVATGSGSLDLKGLTKGTADGGGVIRASVGRLVLGAAATVGTPYQGVSGPSTLGTGSNPTFASSGTGSVVGVDGSTTLVVPFGYVSGADLGTTVDTWSNNTLASIGLSTGNYVYTWGTGPDADSLTIEIMDGSSSAPEPGSLSLLGLAGLALLPRRRGGPVL